MKAVAVCDIDPARTVVAQGALPDITTYNYLGEMLKNKDIDNVIVILPHNQHYPAAMECMKAGKASCSRSRCASRPTRRPT